MQPAARSLDKGNRMEKVLGEGRMRLFDKMVSSRGSGMGKKTNPRYLLRRYIYIFLLSMYVCIYVCN